jgi:hypothetical protein
LPFELELATVIILGIVYRDSINIHGLEPRGGLGIIFAKG